MRKLLAALLALPLAAAVKPYTPIDGLPIAALPPQQLPASGCAAYLFTTGQTRAFAAMASAEPGVLTLALGGKTVTLARTMASGSNPRGFPASATYAGEGATASLAMTVSDRVDLRGGATVPQASLTLERTGADSVIVPLAGLVACTA